MIKTLDGYSRVISTNSRTTRLGTNIRKLVVSRLEDKKPGVPITERITHYSYPSGSTATGTIRDEYHSGKRISTYSTKIKDPLGNTKHKVEFPQRHKPNGSLVDKSISQLVKDESLHPFDFYQLPQHLQRPILEKAVDSGKTDFAASLLKEKFTLDRAARALSKILKV